MDLVIRLFIPSFINPCPCELSNTVLTLSPYFIVILSTYVDSALLACGRNNYSILFIWGTHFRFSTPFTAPSLLYYSHRKVLIEENLQWLQSTAKVRIEYLELRQSIHMSRPREIQECFIPTCLNAFRRHAFIKMWMRFRVQNVWVNTEIS